MQYSLIQSCILLNMKPENNRTSSLIAGLICIISALIIAGITTALLITYKDEATDNIGFVISFISPIVILLLFFGVRSIVRGFKTYRIVKHRRIREAKILSVEPLQGTSLQGQLVVSFYGESGNENQLILTTLWTRLEKLEVGQYIQCYVNGETGYIDVSNIKVVREKQEEINFE